MGNFTPANVMPYHISCVWERTGRDPFNWCYDTFGSYGDRWKTMNQKTVFCFHNEEDAIFFKLKFG